MGIEQADLSKPQIGFTLDVEGRHEDTIAMLSDSDGRIELAIPYICTPEDMNYRKFVSSYSGIYLDNQKLEPVQLPQCMKFLAAENRYTLIGCRIARTLSTDSIGKVVIVPDRVVVGFAKNNYERIDGLRSTVEGLIDWVGESSIDCVWKLDAEGRSHDAVITLTHHSAISVLPSRGLQFAPFWREHGSVGDRSMLIDQPIYISTLQPNSDWGKQILIHRQIATLLSISEWKPKTFKDMGVYKATDNPLTDFDKIPEEEWHPVISYYPVVDRTNSKSVNTNYLFTYKDIGNEGIDQWLYLCEECMQGIETLAYLANEFENLSLTNKAVLTGIVLECIGWLIIRENNQAERICRRHDGTERARSFNCELDAIIEEFHGLFPLKDAKSWKTTMIDSYMGSKHPDRNSVAFESLYTAVMESLLVIRMWIGLRLGADYKVMRKNLPFDSVGSRLMTLLTE